MEPRFWVHCCPDIELGGCMNDETMGQEDAAQDAEACAEALESLDRISLDEIAFDDSGVDVQDEPEAEAGIPAGKLPANAGACAGDPDSFG